MQFLKNYRLIDLPLNLAVLLIYLVLAKLSLVFSITETGVTLFWPAGGFALAILLLAGPKYIPGVFAGALAAGLVIGATLTLSISIALGNTLETVLAYWLLTTFQPINRSLHTHKDYFKLLFYGAIISTLISAAIGPISLFAFNLIELEQLPTHALHWWMGDAIGITLMTPLILVWSNAHQQLKHHFFLEIITLFALTFLIGQSVFFHWFRSLSLIELNVTWLFPFIIWSGLRAGRRYTATLIFIIFLQALWSASHGIGLYANAMQDNGLINFWLFGILIAIGGMLLTIITSENHTEKYKTQIKTAELQSSEKRLKQALKASKQGWFELNIQTGEVVVNSEYPKLLGYEPSEFHGNLQEWQDNLHPDDHDAVMAAFHDCLSSDSAISMEYRRRKQDGSWLWFHSTAEVSERGPQKQPLRMVGIHSDITTRKLAEDELKLAARVFSHAREGITITDAEGTILNVNDTFTQTTGYSREEAIGNNPRFLQSGRQSPEFYADMWKALLEEGYWYGEVWNRRKNGEVYAEMKTISAVRDAQGITTNYVALCTDITPMKEHQQQLERIAHYDVLTNLPNRSLLADRPSQAMVQSQRRQQSVAVVFLDLDGFKEVNDTHGHELGDELLIAISERMEKALREGDTLARFGGDEFVAVLVDLEKVEDCEPLLERLLLAASEPLSIENTVLKVSASIGVTLYPQDNSDADILIRHADQAMYMAKQDGKNCYHLFDTTYDNAIKTQREGLEDIRKALDKHQFVLHYQPKVNMKTGIVIGAEALIRWQHPERGLLNPGEFLPLIENHVMSIEVGEWVLDTVLTQIGSWQKIGFNLPVSTSVNIAAVQLQQNDFVSRLTALLAAHPDVEPHYI